MRSFSRCEFQPTYELATSLNLAAFNLQGRGTREDPSVICFSASQLSHLPEGYREHPFVASSIEALAEAVGASTDRWGRIAIR